MRKLLFLIAILIFVPSVCWGQVATPPDSSTIAGWNFTTLTEEEVEDFVGGMLGGTETRITVDYQDVTNDIDFVVDSEPWDSLTAWANKVNAAACSLASWANEVNASTDSLAAWTSLINEAKDSLTSWANEVNAATDSLTSWANEVNIVTDSLASWANKVNTALQLAGGIMTGPITMPDDGWIGLGTAKIEFLDEAADSIRLWCYLRGRFGLFTTLSTTSSMYVGSGLTVAAGIVDFPVNVIDDTEIDWGTGSGQVSATDLPDFGTVTTTDDFILVADGTDFEGVAMSGDVTTNNGVMAITAQAIVGDDIDSTDEAFVFSDAYHVTSGEGDSAYVSRKEMRGRSQERAFTIKNIAATDDFKLWKTPVAITIDSIFGQCDGGTNVVGALDEYDWDNTDLVAVVNADWTFTTTYQAIGSFTNAGIAAKNHLKWHTTSVSGVVDFFDLTIWYHED